MDKLHTSAIHSVPEAELTEAIDAATLVAARMCGHARAADADEIVGDCLLEAVEEFDPTRANFKTYLAIKVRNRIQDGRKAAKQQREKTKGLTEKQEQREYERLRCSSVGFYTSSPTELAEAAEDNADAPLRRAATEALRSLLEAEYPLSFGIFALQEASPVRLSTKHLAERLNVTREAIRAAQKVAKYHFEKILEQLKRGQGS